jgi:hypothetical protein
MIHPLNNPHFKATVKALNRIAQYDHKRGYAAVTGGVLYHYTTAEGLKGIIEQKEIWASSAYYMNDSAEVMYGYGVLGEALDEWIAKRAILSNSEAVGFAQMLKRNYAHDFLERNIITPIYMVCFCEEANLLSQWRAYGYSGGYNIGIQAASEGPAAGLRPEPNVYTARWIRVEYDRTEQKRRCLSILDALLPILDEPEVTNAIRQLDTLNQFGYQGFVTSISDILFEESLSFKDKAFEVEKEWRIVIRSRAHLKQGTDDGDHLNLPVRFRTARGQLIPYVLVLPAGGALRLPLTSIRIGPTPDKISAWMAVRMLLDKEGYGQVKIAHSNIPLSY